MESQDTGRANERRNSGKTDGRGVAATATPDVTHPRGLWAGHAPPQLRPHHLSPLVLPG